MYSAWVGIPVSSAAHYLFADFEEKYQYEDI